MARSAELIMNIGYGANDKAAYGTYASTFAERLTTMSDGTIKVMKHCCGKMGSEVEMFKKLQLGTLDGAVVATFNISGFYPKIDVLTLPYMFQNYDHALRVVDGPVGEKIWGDMPEKVGTHLLAIPQASFTNLHNSKFPVNSFEDFLKLKLRVPSSAVILDTYKAWGGNPVPISWNEVPTALQTGMVDGGMQPITTVYYYKFYETSKHIAMTEAFGMIGSFVVSDKFMKKLTPEQKELVLKVSNIAEATTRQHIIEDDKLIVQKLKGLGIKFTKPDKKPFRDRVKPVHNKFIKKGGAPHAEIVDAIKALAN